MVIMKVVDGQRGAHYLKKLNEFVPGKRFLSVDIRSNYTYKRNKTAKRIKD